jgi:hypothetical protein
MFYMIAYTIRYDEEIYEEKFTNADDMRNYYEESGMADNDLVEDVWFYRKDERGIWVEFKPAWLWD